MIPQHHPTRRPPGLSAAFVITQSTTGDWSYACRDCRRVYAWPREQGSFRRLPPHMQRRIRAHAASHRGGEPGL